MSAISSTDGANIRTNTLGKGNAGNIVIQVKDFVSLKDSTRIRTVVEPKAIGNGGTISLKASSLSITGGSQLSASVFRAFDGLPGGRGDGGDIILDVSNSVNISGVETDGFSSGILANTESGAEGAAGNVTINTNFLGVSDGAIINSQTNNLSRGGNISINANTFEALGGGQIITTTDNSGDAGIITVNAKDLVTLSGSDPTFANRLAQFGSSVVSNVEAGSGLFARSDGTGTAGNVTINSPQLTIENGAEISAASVTAQGGDIILQGLDTLQVSNSNIAASTESGRAGNLTVTTTESVQLDN